MTRAALFALGCLALGSFGCAGAMGRADDAFEEGRYPDAVAELRALEPRAAGWSGRKRAHYVLERGLTHLACGDLVEAKLWLDRAKSEWLSNPRLYSEAERGRLFAAWRSMGLMPGELATN